jgi:hypothetical protein
MGWDGASALSGRSWQLTSLAESAPGLDQYAIRKFAEAFEVRTRDRRPQYSMGLARMLIYSILQHTALSEIDTTCICPRLQRANAHIAVAQTIPRTLAENAGYKADEVMAALYAAHENGDKNVGSPAAPRRLCSTLNTIVGLDFPLRVTGYQTRGCRKKPGRY